MQVTFSDREGLRERVCRNWITSVDAFLYRADGKLTLAERSDKTLRLREKHIPTLSTTELTKNVDKHIKQSQIFEKLVSCKFGSANYVFATS